MRDWVGEILSDRTTIAAAKGARPRGVPLGKRALRRKSLHEAMPVEGVSLAPWLRIDGSAIGRINPPAINEHGRILSGPQQRCQDVHAGRSIASTQRVDDLLPVIVDPSDVNSAEAGGGGIARPVSYTHLRAHETRHDLVCRLL